MLQDLCRPERTHRGLSLAFIRRRGEGGGATLGEERQKQRGGEGEGIGSEGGVRRKHAFHKTRGAVLFEVGQSRASGSLS